MEDCEKMEERVRKLEADNQQMKADVKTLEERVSKHGVELDDMRIKNAANEAVLNRIDRTVSKIDERMDAQQLKPAQRWEDLVKQVIALVVAALVGMVMVKIGLQ